MKGAATQVKVHYRGKEVQDDFIILLDDLETYKKWQGDKSIPLAHFAAFEIFVTNNQGVQGKLQRPADGVLKSEFGTEDEDEVIKAILEKGSVQESSMPERQGPKNDSKGPMVAH